MMVDHDIDEAKREKVLIENNLLEPTWNFQPKLYFLRTNHMF